MALALIVLAGALLAGASLHGRSATRFAASRQAEAIAEARWGADAAAFVSPWDPAADSLLAGAELRRTMGPTRAGVNGETTTSRTRLLRLDARRFLLAVATQVGPDSAIRARRHWSILLQYPPIIDSSAPRPSPTPVGHWAMSHLY